jgi:glycosyltransferase involved in cell wall biosynthesis
VSNLRVAIVSDLAKEGWRAMDLVAEMLLLNLQQRHSDRITATQIRPDFAPRLTGWPSLEKQWLATSMDRFLNRFWDYRRLLIHCRDRFDFFHIVDHSYGHLALELPPGRTVVTCHDIDAFRALRSVGEERRPILYRMMARRSLNGLRRAAVVTCVSEWTRNQLLRHSLIPPDRLLVVPNGVAPVCRPDPDPKADAEAESLLGRQSDDRIEIVHVGTTRPRKRIDVLLNVFSSVIKQVPNVHLVRLGGDFTPAQNGLARTLGVERSISTLPFVSKEVMAAIYRRARLAMLTSEREGFGLPLIEALACNVPVVATDLPVFRELGGDAATYCALGNIAGWTKNVVALLEERARAPEIWEIRRRAGVLRASTFSWTAYADAMASIYEALANGKVPAGPHRDAHDLGLGTA